MCGRPKEHPVHNQPTSEEQAKQLLTQARDEVQKIRDHVADTMRHVYEEAFTGIQNGTHHSTVLTWAWHQCHEMTNFLENANNILIPLIRQHEMGKPEDTIKLANYSLKVIGESAKMAKQVAPTITPKEPASSSPRPQSDNSHLKIGVINQVLPGSPVYNINNDEITNHGALRVGTQVRLEGRVCSHCTHIDKVEGNTASAANLTARIEYHEAEGRTGWRVMYWGDDGKPLKVMDFGKPENPASAALPLPQPVKWDFRRLSHDFLTMSHESRLWVAEEAGLLTPDEIRKYWGTAGPLEMEEEVFRRAKERDIVSKLALAIDKRKV